MNNFASLLFSFDGRINRKQFWLATFFWLSVLFLVAHGTSYFLSENLTLPIFFLFMVVSGISNIAFSIKRFHDIGKSGWLYLLYIIPLVSLFVFIYLGSARGEEQANKYGSPQNGLWN